MDDNKMNQKELYFESGIVVNYDPITNNVYIESTDYHSGKLKVTEELLNKIYKYLKPKINEVDNAQIIQNKYNSKRSCRYWKIIALFIIIVISLLIHCKKK